MKPVLLITGGSSGIGAACAGIAAARGYDIALNYRSSTADAEAVAGRCRAAGADVLLCQADVADPDAITAMYAQIDDHFGRLNALIELRHDEIDDEAKQNAWAERLAPIFTDVLTTTGL